MEDIEITYRDRLLVLCLLILAIVGIFASFWAFMVFCSVIAFVFLILCILLVLIILGIYQSQEFQHLVMEEAKERGGYKIKNWKENWKWFFIVLTVGVLCLFVLFSPRPGDDFEILVFYAALYWPFLQGYWAYRIYCVGKEMKAARLLCRAKYEGMTSLRDCMRKQTERCKRVTGQGRDHSDSPGDLEYEPDWRVRARLQAYVEVNYESWLKKYIESSQEEKEKEDKLWEEFVKTLEAKKEEIREEIREANKNAPWAAKNNKL